MVQSVAVRERLWKHLLLGLAQVTLFFLHFNVPSTGLSCSNTLAHSVLTTALVIIIVKIWRLFSFHKKDHHGF